MDPIRRIQRRLEEGSGGQCRMRLRPHGFADTCVATHMVSLFPAAMLHGAYTYWSEGILVGACFVVTIFESSLFFGRGQPEFARF